MRSSLSAVYLRLDRRVLGIFRILFGLVLLYDVARRFPDAALLWSDEGVLSVESLRRAPQDASQFSLLFLVSSASGVKWAFGALSGVFLLYTLGLCTRLMQVLTLVGYASLNARNLFFEDGGTACVILLATWTLPLPLGERFSLDALRREAALGSVRERVAARAERRAPLVTLAALALLLQAAAIYWLNAVHKSGYTWRLGDAVHLVLWQHRVNTPLAVWLAAHEPGWLSPVLTWLTVRVEYVLPILLLWPTFTTATRSVALLLAVLLHGGIALCLTLGPFSYAMMCLVWLCVPGAALDALQRRLPRRWWWLLAARRARWQRGFRRWQAGRAPARAAPGGGAPALRRLAPRLREATLGMMLIVETCNLLSSNRAVPKALQPGKPEWLLAYKHYLRGWQAWSMFAPQAPEDDGTLVVDAVTQSGRRVDPFTGREPDFEQVRRGVVPYSIAVSDYLFNMRSSANRRYRHDLRRYLRRYGAARGDAFVSAQAWWVSYVPPKRGAREPGPIRKELLFSFKL